MVEGSSGPVIAVLGPTGSGKSDLGLLLAARLGGEILNYDSIQVYRGFEIGAAKIPLQDRRGVPHHLLDVIGPGEELSAGSYARMARAAIRDIHERGRVPVLVGGTGFYLRALLDGLSPAPERNPGLRQRLDAMANRRRGILHRVLTRYDAAAAARIHPNDTPKLIRAIEITFASGRPVTEVQSAPRQALMGTPVLKLGLAPDRKLLYSRLDKRTAWMFCNGLIDETKWLLKIGYAPDSKPMRSLGYKQALQFLSGERTLDQAITECQLRTRQYAKRQVTWFRAERDLVWLDGFGSEERVQDEGLQRSSSFLANLKQA
jgi:tRNA dimethylallyltransferase